MYGICNVLLSLIDFYFSLFPYFNIFIVICPWSPVWTFVELSVFKYTYFSWIQTFMTCCMLCCNLMELVLMMMLMWWMLQGKKGLNYFWLLHWYYMYNYAFKVNVKDEEFFLNLKPICPSLNAMWMYQINNWKKSLII